MISRKRLASCAATSPASRTATPSPSLETLQKIARALDLQLSEFFAEEVVGKEMSGLNLGEEEIRFLTQVQRYSAHLSESDRRLLLAMVRKFAYRPRSAEEPTPERG